MNNVLRNTAKNSVCPPILSTVGAEMETLYRIFPTGYCCSRILENILMHEMQTSIYTTRKIKVRIRRLAQGQCEVYPIALRLRPLAVPKATERQGVGN